MHKVNIYIQARMSSNRYPGKVLAPLWGVPVIKHLVDRANAVKAINQVIVLTSIESSDDPLVAYLETLGVAYYRGSLENVFLRFKEATYHYPSDYFVRLCADSPLIHPGLIDYAIGCIDDQIDLISNVFSRTFPYGQAVELIKTSLFNAVKIADLTAYEQEHVMPYFYNQTKKFSILSFDYSANESHKKMCIDFVDELQAIQEEKPTYIMDASKIRKKVCDLLLLD